MSSREVTDSHDEPLDRLSGMLEAVGFPHVIARVYAALTLAEGEGLSTTEIVEQLGVSKASISNAMQFLVGTDLVERYRVPGTREAHYRMLKGRWGEVLSRKVAATGHIRRIAGEVLGSTTSPRARERLEEMHDVYAFFEQEFEGVIRRFNERNAS
ncbi:MAG: helix-turn-helix domain-containing protein [Coriobacteriia bacterium]|nr:helix-turn-helix domain-containing protein [Coriobacteriia bacterium]